MILFSPTCFSIRAHTSLLMFFYLLSSLQPDHQIFCSSVPKHGELNYLWQSLSWHFFQHNRGRKSTKLHCFELLLLMVYIDSCTSPVVSIIYNIAPTELKVKTILLCKLDILWHTQWPCSQRHSRFSCPRGTECLLRQQSASWMDLLSCYLKGWSISRSYQV